MAEIGLSANSICNCGLSKEIPPQNAHLKVQPMFIINANRFVYIRKRFWSTLGETKQVKPAKMILRPTFSLSKSHFSSQHIPQFGRVTDNLTETSTHGSSRGQLLGATNLTMKPPPKCVGCWILVMKKMLPTNTLGF